MSFRRLPLLALLLVSGRASAQIYADFQTSMGNFTCELNDTAAPKTVANFVGLATGEKGWIDPVTGGVKENTPFYDGLTFHRVIKDFMNQSGSRNALGTDGPGYLFPDETLNGLTHQPYVISMANSGSYTNGSQFFITAVETPWLDGMHTVFGSVTSGTAVIDAINNVATTSDRPDVPVIIEKVTIRRQGSAAEAFDIQAQGLPTVSNVACDLSVTYPSKVEAIPRQPRPGGTVTSVFSSGDLISWTQASTFTLGTGPASADALEIYLPSGSSTTIPDKCFFRFARASYTDAMKPQSYAGRTLVASWNAQTITFTFNAAGDGGSALYSEDDPPAPREILNIHDFSSPYDMVFDVEGFGGIKVSAACTSEDATHFLGTQKISQWDGSAWNLIGVGTASLSK